MIGQIRKSTGPRMGSGLLIVALSALMLSACSGQPIKVAGEAPLVRLDSLSRQDSGLVAGVSIRNINDSPLELGALLLDLELDEQSVRGGIRRTLNLSIAARGREVIEFRFDSGDQVFDALDEVSTGERTNLPWSLTLYRDSQTRRNELANAQGFLHRVPGQPNRFR